MPRHMGRLGRSRKEGAVDPVRGTGVPTGVIFSRSTSAICPGELAGLMLRTLASGHPHEELVCMLQSGPLSPQYCGRAVLACVARQLRTVNGLSMLISKWRRRFPAGSSGSNRDMRITICMRHVSF